MTVVTFKPDGNGCAVATGVLRDACTATTIRFSRTRPTRVQIDHVMPLAYDWAQGASRWTEDKRRQIANDPLNVIAVDGPANNAKSDSGPAEWLPANGRIHCAYAVRFARVSIKYSLPVRPDDKRMMLNLCGAR